VPKNKLQRYLENLGRKLTGNTVPPMPPVPSPQQNWDWLPLPSGGAQNREIQAKAVGVEVRERARVMTSAHYEDLEIQGMERISERRPGLTPAQVVDLWVNMVQILEEAPLTINFNAGGFFATPNDSTNYNSWYQKDTLTVHGKVRDVVKLDGTREPCERKKVLQMGMSKNKDANGPRGAFFGRGVAVDRFANLGGIDLLYNEQGKKIVLAKNPDFVGASRPRYAAINYANYRNGAVPHAGYGNSCFVLNNRLKKSATFSSMDSFEVDSKDEFCTLDTIGALIAWTRLKILDELIDVAEGRFGEANGEYQMPDPGVYILEAQLYAPVEFKLSCVTAVRLSYSEAKGPVMENASDFCLGKGIPLEYVP
jgi:hypothetical protein